MINVFHTNLAWKIFQLVFSAFICWKNYYLKTFLCNFTINHCCCSILDKPFSTGVESRSKQIKWWSVDLIALCKIHLVRIVTASGYKPEHLKGLKIQAGK